MQQPEKNDTGLDQQEWYNGDLGLAEETLKAFDSYISDTQS